MEGSLVFCDSEESCSETSSEGGILEKCCVLETRQSLRGEDGMVCFVSSKREGRGSFKSRSCSN